jgi:hypothetical protein
MNFVSVPLWRKGQSPTPACEMQQKVISLSSKHVTVTYQFSQEKRLLTVGVLVDF